MKTPSLFRTGGALLLATVMACADSSSTVAPARAPSSASLAKASSDGGGEDRVVVSPRIAEINAALANAGTNVRLAKVEMLRSSDWNGVSSTLIVANDRVRGIGAEWVKGDPNRDGRLGVSYQVLQATRPAVINPDRATARLATFAEVDAQVEESMAAWRNESCSEAPITRVGVPAGTDPNFVDNFFLGLPLGANYRQTADIVQSGWYPAQFFRNIATFFNEPPASGDGIIGITFTFNWVDENGTPTDLDRNKKGDIALAEIYYNARFVYDNSGLVDLRVIDYFSVIAHETGHALGLSHLGKIFVTGPAQRDGIQLADIKHAPFALMNASYIAGQSYIAGLDRSAFCQIWASR
jgi:hypothetical protein